MTLRKFVNRFILPNTLVRLWYKSLDPNFEHEIVSEKLFMEWVLLHNEFSESKVVGVTDILVANNYPEAVNIVIERGS